MPYICAEQRELFMDPNTKATAPGELNFIISRLVDGYITRKGMGYVAINEVMGVLACVQAELYRRVVAPYEDKKCRENGEVYLNV